MGIVRHTQAGDLLNGKAVKEQSGKKSYSPWQMDSICDTMAEAIRSIVGTSRTLQKDAPHKQLQESSIASPLY